MGTQAVDSPFAQAPAQVFHEKEPTEDFAGEQPDTHMKAHLRQNAD